MKIAWLILTLFAGTVFAADFEDVAESSEIREACKGVENGSYHAIERCGWSKFKALDAELNKSYKALFASVLKEPVRKKRVLESQRAWVLYRKNSCDFWIELRPPYDYPWCYYEATKLRLAQVKLMHSCFMAGGGEVLNASRDNSRLAV